MGDTSAAFAEIGQGLQEVGGDINPGVLVAEVGAQVSGYNLRDRSTLQPPDRFRRGGKPVRGGANTCSIYYKFLLKTLFVTAIAVGLYVGGPYVASAVPIGEWLSSAFATLNQSCVGGPLGWTGLQIGYCGLLTKLQSEILSLVMNQNLETLKTALLAIGGTLAGLSLKDTIKNVWNKIGSTLDMMVEDFCEKFHSKSAPPQRVDAGSQTVQQVADQVGPSTKGSDIRTYLVKKEKGGKRRTGGDGGFGTSFGPLVLKGGARRGRGSKTRKTPMKMGKSRRARRSTSRSPLFIY
jgi:hypothetical protein